MCKLIMDIKRINKILEEFKIINEVYNICLIKYYYLNYLIMIKLLLFIYFND
jgi:hypothetical protein